MVKYLPGQSGNPTGKKKGTLNKHTKLAKLLEPYAETLVNKAVEMAIAGDVCALRLCIERLIPKATNEAINIQLPNIDITQRYISFEMGKAILQTLSGKEINFAQTKNLLSMLKICTENAPINSDDPDLLQAKKIAEELMLKNKREY